MRTLNLRFACGLLILLISFGIGLYFLHQFQFARIANDIAVQARAARAGGENADAIRLAYHYLQFKPDDPVILEELAGWMEEKAVARKQLASVAALLDRSLQITPERTDLRRRLIALNLKIGRWGECLDHLDRMLPESPDDAELLAALGVCKEAIGKPSEAAAAFEKAWRLDPKRIATALDYALLLARHLGRPDDARKILEQAVHTNPDNAEVRVGLARYYRAVGKLAEAEIAANEAIRLAPKDVNAFSLLAEIYQAAGKVTQARTTLQQAADLAPNDQRVTCSLAWLLLYDGKTDEAIARLQSVLREQSGNIEVLTLLGDILALDGRIDALEKIVNDLQRMRRAAPEREWNADYLQARLFMRRGDWNRAANMLEQLRLAAAKNVGLSKQCNYLLALCYDQLFDRTKELDSYRRILEADGQAGYFRLEYSRTLARVGRYPDAIKELRAAIQRPDLPPRTVMEVLTEIVDRSERAGAAKVVKDLEKALEPVKADDPAFYQILCKVELLRLQHRAHEALNLANQYLAKRPHQSAMLSAQFRLLDDLYGTDRALAAVAEAEKRLGDLADFRLARLKLLANRYDPSRHAALFALADGLEKFNPEDRTAILSELLLVCQGTGDQSAISQALERLRIARADHLPVRFLLLTRAHALNDQPTAAKLLTEIASIEGDHGFTQQLITANRAVANSDSDSSAISNAKERVNELAKISANHPMVAYLNGRLAELTDQPGAALEHYRSAINNNLLDQPIEEEFRRLAEMDTGNRRCRVLVEETPLTDRLRLDADRFLIAKILQLPAASARGGVADRILRGNPSATPAQLVWFADQCAKVGLNRHSAVALARATSQAPLSDDAWTARIAFYAQKQDINQIQQLVIEAKRQYPNDPSALVLTRSLERAGLSTDIRRAIHTATGLQVTENKVSRDAIQRLLHTGRIDDGRKQLQSMIDRSAPDSEDMKWARRTLAINLTIAPSTEAFQKSLRLLEANRNGGAWSDDDLRAIAQVYAVQKSRRVDNITARQRAIQLFEELTKRPGRQPDDVIQLARLYRMENNPSSYQQKIDQLIQAYPRHAVTMAFVAHEALRRGDLELADKSIATLESTGQKSFEVLILRCTQLTLAGQGGEAVSKMNKFIADAAAGTSRAASQLRCGHAAWEILHSYPLSAQSSSAHVLRDAAIQWYQTGLGRDPNALLHLVVLMCKSGRTNQALDFVQSAQDRSGFSKEACLTAAVNIVRFGQPSQQQIHALDRQIESLLAKEPQSIPLLLVKADFCDAQRRYDEATTLYRQVLDREPANVMALNNLAWTLAYDPGKIGDALGLINDAIDRTGPLDDLLDTRARILFAAGRREEALRDLTDAAMTAPSATRFFYLAVMQRQSEPAQAEASLQRAKQFGLSVADVHPRDAAWYREMLGSKN